MGNRNRRNNQRVVIETQQIGWSQLREKVLTDDATVLTVTTQDFANRNSGTGNAVSIPYGVNKVKITFLGIATDQTAAFTWTLYAFREPHGPGQKVAYGTGNLGDVAVNKHPVTGAAVTAYYADYLTITAQYWEHTVVVKDIGAASGEIATISVDLEGCSHLLLELTACDAGTANETDELESVYTGY